MNDYDNRKVIKLEWRRGEAHDRVIVFIGPDRDHLARCGELTMRPDEAERFRYTVRQGVRFPGFTGSFEGGWGDDE